MPSPVVREQQAESKLPEKRPVVVPIVEEEANQRYPEWRYDEDLS